MNSSIRNIVIGTTLLFWGSVLCGQSMNAAAPASPTVDLFSIQPPMSSDQPVSSGTWLRIRGYGIYSEAEGHFSLGPKVPNAIRDIDLHDNLGMDLSKGTGGALVGFDSGRFHFDLAYNGYYDYNGKKNVGSIAINGKVFTADVKSSADVQEGAAVLGFDFIKPQGLGLTVTGLLDTHLYYLQTKEREVIGIRSNSYDLWVPIPAPGLAVRYDFTPNIYAKVQGNGIWAGDLASYADLSGEVGYDFNRNVGIFVGYRYWLLNVNYDNNSFHFYNNSIYAGLEVRL